MILRPKSTLVFCDLVRVTLKFLFACLALLSFSLYQPNEAFLAAWAAVAVMLYVLACIFIVRLDKASRPWLEVSRNGVRDATPFGLGDLQWSDIRSASLYGGSGKRLGFELVDLERILSRHPVWKRRLFTLDRWLSAEPPVRFQQRAFSTSLDTVKEHLVHLVPVTDSSSLGYCWSTMAAFTASGFLLMFIALWTFPDTPLGIGDGGITIPIVVAVLLLLATGQLPLLYAAAKGSRLSAVIDLVLFLLIVVAGSVFLLAMNFGWF